MTSPSETGGDAAGSVPEMPQRLASGVASGGTPKFSTFADALDRDAFALHYAGMIALYEHLAAAR